MVVDAHFIDRSQTANQIPPTANPPNAAAQATDLCRGRRGAVLPRAHDVPGRGALFVTVATATLKIHVGLWRCDQLGWQAVCGQREGLWVVVQGGESAGQICAWCSVHLETCIWIGQSPSVSIGQSPSV